MRRRRRCASTLGQLSRVAASRDLIFAEIPYWVWCGCAMTRVGYARTFRATSVFTEMNCMHAKQVLN